MIEFKGFDAKYRRYFSQLVRRGVEPITIQQASALLNVSHDTAKQILTRLTRSGWLSRVKQGLYIPVSPAVEGGGAYAGDPWVLANTLFNPCYIGGWDAISHWDFTEQIFIHTFVYTQTPQKKVKQTYLGHTFIAHKVPKEQFFGLETVWKQNVKLKISDPTRTIVDLLDAPHHYGSSSTLFDVFREYLKSKHKNIELLIHYALTMNNKAILKRLGFLLDAEDIMTDAINLRLLEDLSPGKAKLVPSQSCPKLVTKWQLWVPERLKEYRK
jgi:predicted transcriptional regulator of viral defense system